MKKLVLFDIDGTILWTNGAGRRAIHAALSAEIGPFSGHDVRFDGKTDPQIVRELLVAAGHPDPDHAGRVDAVCRRYLTLLESELANGAEQPRVFPGVMELIDLLELRGDCLVGLLTGNLASGARLKLGAAGIDFARFQVGAFGSDAWERSALPPIAAERAEPLMGRRPAGDDVVIIGDTPNDMTCGRELGARAIGVATGSYTVQDLLDAGGEVAFEDLSEPTLVLQAILA